MHTPGPWKIGYADHPDYMGDMPEGSIYVEAAGNDLICEIDSCGLPLPTHEANARLIAAAPMLLESLLIILAAYRDSINGPEVDAARKAVALARGI